MSEKLPIPEQAIALVNKSKARKAIEALQLENVLLKHLVDMLDPEHDYQFDQDNMTLLKVLKEEKSEEDAVQSSDSKNLPFRGKVDIGGKAKGLREFSNKPDPDEAGPAEETVEEVVLPAGNPQVD